MPDNAALRPDPLPAGGADEPDRPEMLDALIVGGGPAGMAAAIWLARYRRRLLVLDSGEYRNRWVEAAHGYLGHDPVNPSDLRRTALADLARYGGTEVRPVRARSARRAADGRGDHFEVEAGDELLRARRLVLATGVADEFPEVAGFFDHYGASVFHCPSCDGYEARGCQVVVFGWSPAVVGFAAGLLEWAAAVTVVTDGKPFEGEDGSREALARRGIDVLEDDAVELIGTRGALRAVRLRGGQELECQLAFFNIAHHPLSDIADQLGCRLTPEGCVEVDEEARTSVSGVWAAGDLTPGIQVMQVAAAKGAVAGISCARSLSTPLE